MSGAAAGGGPGPVAQGLKEALVETLNGILCPVQGVRAAAEEQVKVLEVTEGECVGERLLLLPPGLCRRRKRESGLWPPRTPGSSDNCKWGGG